MLRVRRVPKPNGVSIKGFYDGRNELRPYIRTVLSCVGAGFIAPIRVLKNSGFNLRKRHWFLNPPSCKIRLAQFTLCPTQTGTNYTGRKCRKKLPRTRAEK